MTLGFDFQKVPFFAPPYHSNALIEVSATFGNEPASAKLICDGIVHNCDSSATAYAAYPPSSFVFCPEAVSVFAPISPHTLSPTFNLVQPSPTAMTVPATSDPRTWPRTFKEAAMLGYLSEGFTLEAFTFHGGKNE